MKSFDDATADEILVVMKDHIVAAHGGNYDGVTFHHEVKRHAFCCSSCGDLSFSEADA